MKRTNCEACKGTGAGERPDPVCKVCDGRGRAYAPYPVHVVTSVGAQFVGILQSEREIGNSLLVTLEPFYAYSVQGNTEGIQRLSQVPWTLEGAQSGEMVAIIVTELRKGSVDYDELAKIGELQRTEIRALQSGIQLTGQMPERPSA